MNIDKLILCGHSFGGYISSHYAYKYPDRVDNLFLLSTVGFAKREE
jgi:cardiolipin-specific phospholipase